MNNKLLSMTGLAYKAGKIRFGTDSVIESVRGIKKPDLVIAACDISPGTLKKLKDGCAFHGVRMITVPDSMSDLGRMVGGRSGVACVAVLDSGFAARMIELSDNVGSDS